MQDTSTVPPGAPVQPSAPSAPAPSAEIPSAPAVEAPLAGVVVVTIALNLPGPAAAARLQELGADVVTVLPPAGDPVAVICPGLYEELHRGQRVVTVNMKSEAGRARMEELLAGADVLLTSHRSGALVRLGLDAAAVHARHPRICQVDVTGFPGERADVPGHDINYQAEAGLLGTDGPPRALVADMHGAERAVSAALALLLARGRDGVGRSTAVALSDAAAAVALPTRHGLNGPGTDLAGGSPWYGVYPARTGHVAVGALEAHFAHLLAEALDLDVDGDVRAQLTATFAAEGAAHWQAWGEARGIPITEVSQAG